jgi:transposase-like protein
MARKPTTRDDQPNPLARLACPNEDCPLFNRFDAGNLSVVEWIGKRKDIRRLYCSYCGQRFSERRGTLRQYTKLPPKAVERVLKCLSHGCSVRATANICDVDRRTVQRLWRQAGPRAHDFHQLRIEQQRGPLGAVQLDELHGRVSSPKKRSRRCRPRRVPSGAAGSDVDLDKRGFTRPW